MPFYGTASGGVNWGAIYWGWLKAVNIEAGGRTRFIGFSNCIAGYVNGAWGIQNLPMGTEVIVTVYGSCPGGTLTESETSIEPIGENEYRVKYLTTSGYWELATSLKFTATQPPTTDCDYNACETVEPMIPKITNFPDPFFYDPNSAHYLRLNPCDYLDALGHFNIADQDVAVVKILDYCFNKQTQKWNFDIYEPIELISLWGLCNRDEVTFIESINDVPDWYLCPDPIYGGASKFITHIGAKYFLAWDGLKFQPIDLIKKEEFIHFEQFREIIHSPKWQLEFKNMFKSQINYSCQDLSDIQEVENKICDTVKKFRDRIWKNIYERRKSLEKEARTLLLPYVEEWIINAENALLTRCEN